MKNVEIRHQKLADELTASQLAQSQMQTDLANANQSLEALTAKNIEAEQEMEAAYQELSGKEDFVGELKLKLETSESLAESFEEKLKLAQTDFEKQAQETLAAESKIKEMKNEALQSKRQLEEKRTSEMNERGEFASLTAKLAKRTNELEKLQNHIDETTSSRDEKAALLEDSENSYKHLAEEFEALKLSENEAQARHESELATAREEILTLSSKAEQAENEIDTAYQEIQNRDEVTAGLHKGK